MAFVIVGNSSSGTSFCSAVMDAHPDIHCPFEDFCAAHYDDTLELWCPNQAIADALAAAYGVPCHVNEGVSYRYGDGAGRTVTINVQSVGPSPQEAQRAFRTFVQSMRNASLVTAQLRSLSRRP